VDKSPSPDDVCELFAESGSKITIRMLNQGDVLIEGSAAALESLGQLIQAQARFSGDCGFQISPSGAGSALFSPMSSLGIYIHRLPCTNGHVLSGEGNA
jgi:hypothetical protein